MAIRTYLVVVAIVAGQSDPRRLGNSVFYTIFIARVICILFLEKGSRRSAVGGPLEIFQFFFFFCLLHD